MKKITILLPLAALLLAACGAAPVPAPEAPPGEEAAQASEAVPAEEAGERVVEINASNFQFEPALITVKKGEKITLKVNGVEGTHGFAVPGVGVNISVAAGQKVSVALPTDKAGEFDFFCSIPCGPGHADMRGKIVIEE